MNAPMRASVVKSPEHFEFARQTSTDSAGAGPRPKAGPAEAALALVLSERITNLSPTHETVTILSWRLLWSVTLLRPRPTPIRVSLKRTDHQMTYALRGASRSPEASEPHLTNGSL